MSMGFRFGRSAGMEGSTGNLHDHPISPTNTDQIFTGDPVILNAGFVEAFAAGAVVDTDILGIFQGCKSILPDGSVHYAQYWDGNPNQTNIMAQVSVAGSASTFLAELGINGATAWADVMRGRRVGFTAAAGNTATGASGAYITNGAAAAAGPFVIRGPADIPEYQSNRIWVEVGCARPQLGMAVVA